MCFYFRPKGKKQLETLTEENDVQQSHANEAGAKFPSEGDNQNHKQNSNSSNHEVKNKNEPSLNKEELVEWSLGLVQNFEVSLLQCFTPPESPDCDEAVETFKKVGVERRFGFDIEKSQLP